MPLGEFKEYTEFIVRICILITLYYVNLDRIRKESMKL